MTYSWQNADGEPIMSGEAWRFEQQLDMDSQADYEADHFYDNDPADFYDECDECGGLSVDTRTGECQDCGAGAEEVPDGMEDQWLDSYMEDRMTTMFE